MPTRSRVGFVKEFLAELFEEDFRRHKLDTEAFYEAKRFLADRPELLRVSRDLFNNLGRQVDTDALGPLKLVMLRGLNGKEFPFILVTAERVQRKPLKCFVGCRFVADIDRNLEYNLRTILEPWEIHVHLEGRNLGASSLFNRILRSIRSSDMCIFDNLGTSDRPNVYIEAGISLAEDKPMVFCEYAGRSISGLGAIPATGGIPADFRGLTRVQYRSYERLFRDLYFRMPRFLKDNRLR